MLILVGGCAGPDPADPKAPPALPSEGAAADPAENQDDSVVLVSAGGEPRRVHGYAPVAKTKTVVRTELAFYQPVARYQTTYDPVAYEGAVTLLKAQITLDLSGTMMGLLDGLLRIAVGSCSAEIRVDAHGALVRGGPEGGCTYYDAAFFGMRPTPLRPGIRFPHGAIGVGASWQVASANEQAATYVLIDGEQGVSTVFGEIEAPTAAPGSPLSTRPPKAAWILARISPGEILTTSTLAWAATQSEGSTPAPITDIPTALTRINSVNVSEATPRDGIRQALTRALGSPDASVREAAVRASGISNDWWSIETLFALREQDPTHAQSVDRALGMLTGRGARGLEDFIEASAPHACDGDAKRAEAILSSGLALGGAPEERAKLLAFRGEIRRLLGDAAGAHQDLAAAFRLFPGDEDVARTFAWWLLTAPNATDRDPKRALEIARSVNSPFLTLSEQLQAAAHAELSNFAQAEELERQVATRLAGKWRFVSNDTSADRRLAAARARLEAYELKRRWPDGLVRDELRPCYRYFGLSHTLL